MRPPTLQYFYLEKPMLLLIAITLISVFLWIGHGDFYTKGEPREAAVAVSMIEKNQWILPEVYADEIAYKPPLMHWLTAVFSLPQGKVTPFSSRLPSALAFLGLVICTFLFFGKNLRMQEAFLSALILLTAFELHRSAMTARVDMMLTFLIVWALTRLFRWEERKKLNGFPLLIPLILGLAALTKGPVGIVLPLLVFGIYLLFLRYHFWKIAVKFIPLTLAAFVLPLLWYLLAYQQGGKEFLDLVWAENFGRFFGMENLKIQYDLGHREGWWYNLITLAAGFVPWTILLFISLFGLSYSKKFQGIKSLWNLFVHQDKINLFSAIAAIAIILFYSIPVSKRSVYLMPAYPFISIFIARFVLYLTEYKPKISRFFTLFIGAIAGTIALIVFLTVLTHGVEPVKIVQFFTKDTALSAQIDAIWQSFPLPYFVYYILLMLLVYAIYVLFKSLRKKNRLKSLYATIGIYLSLFLLMDSLFFPAYKNAISVKPIAKSIKNRYPINKDNLFVMNNLSGYTNMYGINFYLHNRFRNFEKEQAEKGYFLTGDRSFEIVLQNYGKNYRFELLESFPNQSRDGDWIIRLYFFQKK